MNITRSDLGVIYTSLIGITAVFLVVANWRIESRNKKQQMDDCNENSTDR